MSSSSPSASISGERQPLAVILTDLKTHQPGWWLERASWAFVGLGVLLRVARYLMDYPLWWDEAFVAVNFIRRDYFELLRPLDYGQVCPIFFLWCELAAVKLLGFSEWSLRLFPVACAIASVVIFRHVASRVMHGLPLLLAVAIFATSFHPIRHAADVKPYASDLLAALILLAIAVEWWRAPERAGWLWVLAATAPVALALSYPAIFVAAGSVVGLVPMIAKVGRRDVWIAYAVFALSTVSAFLALYLVFTKAQAAANLTAMQTQWNAAFPPLSGPLALSKWLVTVHTGSMFAYPCGGENGASGLTLLLFIIGAGVFWHRGRKTIVLICLAPFATALVAAAMRRYPYGGPVAHGSPARVMQYLAPVISLLSGLGAAAMLALFREPRRRRRAVRAALVFLTVVGVAPLTADAFHPYRSVHARRARQFARQFWPEFVRDAEPVCLRWDLGICEWDSTNLNVAVYLCNQMIYSPQRQQPREPSSQMILASRPLRCVVPLADPADRRVAGWLDGMKKRYQLRERWALAVNMSETGAKPRTECYNLFEFVPRQVARQDHDPGNRIRVDRPVSTALELMELSDPELFSP
jgi:hypothetical protein